MAFGDLLAQISGSTEPSQPSREALPPKRKADSDLSGPADKMARSNQTVANSSRPISQVTKASAGSSIVSKPIAPLKNALQNAAKSTAKTTTLAPPPQEPPQHLDFKPPPKKGSYAEIMARGKAVQATHGQIGKIQHKPVEKLPSKRERQEMKLQQQQSKGASLSKGQLPGKTAIHNGRVGSSIHGKAGKGARPVSSPQVPEKKPKKAATATTGYTGTARPNPAVARATSRPGATSSIQSADRRLPSKTTSRQYRYASEDDDMEDDDEEDYDSDMSSDMEAAAFEVDEEEERAARIARKEDEEALREETRLKREKEEKRKRMSSLSGRR